MARKTADEVQLRLLCHVCKHETNQLLVHSETYKRRYTLLFDTLADTGLRIVTSEIYKCYGCSEFSIKRSEMDGESEHPEVVYIPARIADKPNPLPVWSTELPKGVRRLLREVYVAMWAGSFRLAAMGLRSLLDELFVGLVDDVGGFDQKILLMRKKRRLSRDQLRLLRPTIIVGHAATHRSYQPSSDQVGAALKIVESLLELFYVLAKSEGELKAGVPARSKPAKAAKVGPSPAAPAALDTAPASGNDAK